MSKKQRVAQAPVHDRWVWVENPRWANHDPPQEPLRESACHDRSHFITITCSCGFDMHVHETQLAQVPVEAGIVSLCKGCGDPLIFEPGWLQAAFIALREVGYIA